MPEDPIALANEAAAVLADCENLLAEAAESVRSLPEDRAEVLEARAAAREREKRAYDEVWRGIRGELSQWHKEVAEEEYERALREVSRADRYLATGDLDPEYRKAVARQMAGLLRDESEQRLDNIAARSDDPGLQKTVAECRENVGRAARYVINMFPPVRELQPDEVRKARAEASGTLRILKNPPVDRI